MISRKLTGLSWRELPMVIILGLVIGGAFGQLVKLIAPQPAAVITEVTPQP
jgi:hypothetical protein